MRLLRKISTEKGTAILVVTHDERMIGEVDRVLQLVDGAVVSDESQKKNQGEAAKAGPKAVTDNHAEPTASVVPVGGMNG